MHLRLRHIVTAMLILLLNVSNTSAEERRRFQVYNAANGLADNSAQTINCTKTGRLVISTMGQINFFDGQQFNFIDPSTENLYPLDNYLGNSHLYFDKFHHLFGKLAWCLVVSAHRVWKSSIRMTADVIRSL